MGNSESSNPVRNMDKRTARREYKDAFEHTIESFKRKNEYRKGSGQDDYAQTESSGNIQVFVRKRPIFKKEIDSSEFDVVSCINSNSVVVHDARMHSDMKRQIMHHHEFQFDQIFNERTNNTEVYEATAKKLVQETCKGGYSTCLVYGQTGSGKTFTMSSIYQMAVSDIFRYLEEEVERFSNPPTVSVSFVEIAGDHCRDLLNAFQSTQLLAGGDGCSVHAFPVAEPVVGTEEELLAMVHHGMNIRSTAATGVHDASSRSHAILRIYVQRSDLLPKHEAPASSPSLIEGVLTLVDLAGSEHRIDSMHHGKERRKETGNINASLMALKECIRQRAAGKNPSFQYRKSKLTMALKASFSFPSAHTIVIATVSPASKDTEHSLNTLRHACIMHGQQQDGETRFVTGGTVTTEQVGEINLTEIARKNIGIKKAGGSIAGPKTGNGNDASSKVARTDNKEDEITDKQRARLQRQAENRSLNKMDSAHRQLLMRHRGKLGQEPFQLSRLRRSASAAIPVDSSSQVDDDDAQIEVLYGKKKINKPILEEKHQDVDDTGDEEEAFKSDLDSPPSEESISEIFKRDRKRVEERMSNLSAAASDLSLAAAVDEVLNKHPMEPSRKGRSTPRKSKLAAPLSPSVKDQKISILAVYEAIYLTVDDAVPEHLLQRQFRAVLRLHGYSINDADKWLLQNRDKYQVISHSLEKDLNKGQSNSNTSTLPSVPTLSKEGRQKSAIYVTSPRVTPVIKRSSSSSGLRPSPSNPGNDDISSGSRRGPVMNSPPRRRQTPTKRNSKPGRRRVDTQEQYEDQEEENEAFISGNNTKNEPHVVAQTLKQLEEEATQREMRQAAARATREANEAKKRKQHLDRINKSSAPSHRAVVRRSKLQGEPSKTEIHEKEIERLTSELAEVSGEGPSAAAAVYAMKKNLAMHRAALLREKRLAAQQQQQELQIQQAPVPDQAGDQPSAFRPYSAEGPSKPVVGRNQAKVEERWEMDPTVDRSSRQQDFRNVQDSPHIQLDFSSNERKQYNRNSAKPLSAHLQQRNYYDNNYQSTDSGNQPDNQSYNYPSENTQQNFQQQQRYVENDVNNSGGRAVRGRRSTGAAAAPFANEYTWDQPSY